MLKGPACAGPFLPLDSRQVARIERKRNPGTASSCSIDSRVSLRRLGPQRLRIHNHRVAPTSLGLVERLIRPLEKRLRALACGGHGRSCAHADGDEAARRVLVRNPELFYPFAQALGHFASGLEVGPLQENCKPCTHRTAPLCLVLFSLYFSPKPTISHACHTVPFWPVLSSSVAKAVAKNFLACADRYWGGKLMERRPITCRCWPRDCVERGSLLS